MTYADVHLVLLVRVHVCGSFVVVAQGTEDVCGMCRCSRGGGCVVFILCSAVVGQKVQGVWERDREEA